MPSRHDRQAPNAVCVLPRVIAATRRIAAARLAEGGVLELSNRPPEMRFWGARVSHEVKWRSVGQRLMS